MTMGSEAKPERYIETRAVAETLGESHPPDESGPADETACEVCGGTGELAYFRGRSRFLLSRKECPARALARTKRGIRS